MVILFFFFPKDSSQPGALDIITPKIDQALEYFKQRGIVTSSETSSMCQSEPELDKSLPREKTVSILLSYPSEIVSNIPIIHPWWPPLLEIEISLKLNGEKNRLILSWNQLKFEFYWKVIQWGNCKHILTYGSLKGEGIISHHVCLAINLTVWCFWLTCILTRIIHCTLDVYCGVIHCMPSFSSFQV